MPQLLLRRALLGAAALWPAHGLAIGAVDIVAELAALEQTHGGSLGVAMLDTATGATASHRGDTLFPLCSTFKLLAAACVLSRVDTGAESLARRVVYGPDKLVPYAPVTGEHVGAPGLTVGELCDAAVTLSDNPAGNLLLESLGGPAGLTAWLRRLGDSRTRLDRWEPALNEAAPGDPRDTTTPSAMLSLLNRLVLGDVLSVPSRAQLAAWLVACRTGGKRLRAGAPAGWKVGDKTGGGERNATNDVAVFWPPGRAPVLVTAYYVGSPAAEPERSAVVASVGRLAAGMTG
ncbi:MAG: class A beta-lactamase [Acetobacteraceae bacterium]